MINQKLKISMIEPIGGHGGMEFYDFGLCESISLQGYEVVLYTSDKTKLDGLVNVQFAVTKVYRGIYGLQNRLIRGLRYLRGTFAALLNSRLRKASVAHFHICFFSLQVLVEVLMFRMLGMKIVATVHDVETLDQLRQTKKLRLVTHLLSINIDRFIVHSRFTQNTLMQTMPRAISKISLVTHCDMDFVYHFSGNKQEARGSIGLELPKNAKVILFFGQIKETKGLDLLLKAFSELKNTQSTYLLIAGRAWRTELDGYVKQINEFGIADRVIFRSEYILNENVPAYFASSELIVLPYRKIYNSGVVLRAMHYGTPVICSNLPSFTEVVSDKETGLLFKADDAQSLMECIEYALHHPNELEQMSRNAKAVIAEKYSFDVVGSEMSAVYESL